MRYFSLILFLFLALADVSFGQIPITFGPGRHYYAARSLFFDGRFNEARRGFEYDYEKNCLIDVQQRTYDSIPDIVMVGECFFQLGDYDQALTHYDLALELFMKTPQWLSRLQNVKNPGRSQRPPSPWGEPLRQEALGSFENDYMVRYGDLHAVDKVINQGGGVVNQAMLVPLDARELAKCVALAIRHKAEILGPASKYDPVNRKLQAFFQKPHGLPNHWTGQWIGVLSGLTFAAMENNDRAIDTLGKNLFMPGGLAHDLTATAFYEIGRIRLKTGKPHEARNSFFEAGHLGFFYGDWIVVEESFRHLMKVQRTIDKTQENRFLHEATRNKLPNMVLFTIALELADESLNAKNLNAGLGHLSNAQKVTRNNDLLQTRHGGRYHYLTAQARYMDKKLADGDKSYSNAMKILNATALNVYQLKTIDRLFDEGKISSATGAMTSTAAETIYSNFLGEPSGNQWIADPMDCLAIQSVPRESSFDRWFLLAFQQSNPEKSFRIAELGRNHRFHSRSPFGSRLISLRYLLDAPSRDIPSKYLLDRHDILTIDFPEYGRYAKMTKSAQDKLLGEPVVPYDEAQGNRYTAMLAEYERFSNTKEVMLREMVLSRIKSPSVFPPVLSVGEIREGIPEKTTLLAFYHVRGTYYGFLLSKEKTEMWSILMRPGETMSANVANFLRLIGCKDSSKPVTYKDLCDETWKRTGQELLLKLLGGVNRDMTENMVVVPDGTIWYLPFEALSINPNDPRPLVSFEQLKIRYAPTAALAVPPQLARAAIQEALVVVGKFNDKDIPSAQEALDLLALDKIKISTIDKNVKLPASANTWATQIRNLLVFDYVRSTSPPSDNWSPFSADRSKNSGLSNWLALPWGAPQVMVVPSFSTPAANGSRLQGNGSELFFSALDLQANGNRTLLLARWNTGGITALNLASSFMNEHPSNPAVDAWKKAIFSASAKAINQEKEPRIGRIPEEEKPIANFPFLWASMILIDRGEHLPRPGGEEENFDAETLLEELLKQREISRQELEKQMKEATVDPDDGSDDDGETESEEDNDDNEITE